MQKKSSIGLSIICDEVSRKALIEDYVRNKAVKLTSKTLVQEKNLTKQTEDKHFNCCICLEIVSQPSKCSSCETAFCHGCAEAQRERNNSCPSCRDSPFTSTVLNKFEQKRLEQMEFECPRCDQDVTYEEANSHVGKCFTECEACPARCGTVGLTTE